MKNFFQLSPAGLLSHAPSTKTIFKPNDKMLLWNHGLKAKNNLD